MVHLSQLRPVSALCGFSIACAGAVTIGSIGPSAHALTREDAVACQGVAHISLDDRITGCTAIINSGVVSNENLAVAYYNRGNDYAEKGQFDRAIADYDQAARLKPDSPSTYLNRGHAYGVEGQAEHAIKDYNEAIKLKPDFASAYNDRGSTFDSLGQHDRAIQDYDEAIKLKPDYAEAYNNRGAAYASKGAYDRAIQDYDEAVRLRPDNFAAYFNRGVAYSSLRQFDRAIQDFDKAIDLKPEANIYNSRGAAYAGRRSSMTEQSKASQLRFDLNLISSSHAEIWKPPSYPKKRRNAALGPKPSQARFR